MKFRNFEKIGLASPQQIGDYIGRSRMSWFETNEHFLKRRIERYIDKYRRPSMDKVEIEVCLINPKSKRGNSLLCVIEPYVSIGKGRVRYKFCAREGIVETWLLPKFDTYEDAEMFVDQLCGISSIEELSQVSRRLFEEGESSK